MAQNRIYYATQQIEIKGQNASWGNYKQVAHGVQSISMTTNFNLSQVFELGQVGIYENIEGVPNLEITMTKVLDGYPLLGHLASTDAGVPTLTGRTAGKCDLRLSIYGDELSSATGTNSYAVECSGLYISSWGFDFSLDDKSTESLTLLGNNKIWKGDSRITSTQDVAQRNAISTVGKFNNADIPQGIANHVSMRQNVYMGTGNLTYPLQKSIFPTEIPGINSNGENTADANGIYSAHIGGISIKADLKREDIFELGRRTQFYRSVTFPIEVTSEIEVLATSGDNISTSEAGILTASNAQCSIGGNLTAQTIQVATCEGTIIYLGNQNKLSSVSYGGGDAGGGNVKIKYSYSTFNTMTVIHSGDPNSQNTPNWWTKAFMSSTSGLQGA